MSEIVRTYSSINEFVATLSFSDVPLPLTKGHVMFLHCSFLCITVFRDSSRGEALSQVFGSGHASWQ